MNNLLRLHLISLVLYLAVPVEAGQGRRSSSRTEPAAPATASTTFAPLPESHELASIWNDPDFARRLIGDYGFASDVEPRMSPEEQAAYRDRVVPLLREDPLKAIPVLQELATPSASAVFDFTLGHSYFQQEDLTNAIKHLEAALAKFPDFRRAQKDLAFAFVRDSRYEDAIKPLLRTVALGGGDGKVFGLLGYAYMDQGRYVSAAGAYRQALVYEPDNWNFKLFLVRCSLSTGDYDFALALLDELLQQSPDRETLWVLHANVLIQKEQPAKAAISLEMLRRLGKASPQDLFLLGDLYMAQESRELALTAYLEAIERDGGQNVAKAMRAAQILVSRGAWGEAQKLFAKIRSAGSALSAPDELKLLKLEAKVLMDTGEGAKAIGILEEIVRKNPLDGEALLLAGDHYARNEEPEKAAMRFESAGKIAGFEAEALVKQAQVLVQAQNYTKAVELLRQAQRINPRDNVGRYLEKVEQVARTRAR